MAEGDDVNLGVRVTSESDLTGINEAREGVSGLKGTLGETATELRHLTGSSREGQEIFRGLGAAARGGAAGIGEMIRGLRSLALVATHIMGEGPLGVLLIGLGLIGGAFLAMRGHTEKAGEAMQKTASRAEELKKSIEELGKQTEADFKKMEQGAKALYDQLERLDKLQKESNATAERLDKAKAATAEAQLDLDEQNSLAVAGTPEEREHIKAVFEQRRKVGKLNREGEESSQSVRDAFTEANRSETARTDATNREAQAAAEVRAKQAAADQATREATSFGSTLLEFAKTGEHPITDADETKRRQLADRAFAAQADARNAQSGFEKTRDELGKTVEKSENDQGRLRDARSLDSEVQKKLAIEREVLSQVEAGKANDEAAKAAHRLAEAADKAAKALDKKEERDAKAEAKEEKGEARAEEKESAKEARDSAKHMKEVAESARHSAKAIEEHAKTTVDSHHRIVHTLGRTSRESEKTSRQLQNMASDTSP